MAHAEYRLMVTFNDGVEVRVNAGYEATENAFVSRDDALARVEQALRASPNIKKVYRAMV